MIRLENVCKEFRTKKGKVEAVNNLSFKIKEGELCILLGPSGCGKTTTMKLINRLIPLTSGKIFIDGKDINELNENKLRRNIGYAIQDIGLFPHFTVEQNITTVPMLKGWDKKRQRERAEKLLHLVGMNPHDFLHRYPSELSGGQQQRVGVARSLGADPPILLMDEPFGAIDPITRSKLQDEFLKIQSKLKKTIVFVTHDINEAIKMGDRIALMRNGELVQYDEPANLLYFPKNEFVRNFIGSDHTLKSLRLHKTKEVMKDPDFVILIEEDPEYIKAKMEIEKNNWAIVTDKEKHFLGWVFREELSGINSIKDVLQIPEQKVHENMRLNEALSMMLQSSIGTLPVVDDSNKLAGVLSFNIIREVLSEQMEDR